MLHWVRKTSGVLLRCGGQKAFIRRYCADQSAAIVVAEKNEFIFGDPIDERVGSDGVTKEYYYKTFSDLGLSKQLVSALSKLNKDIPTLIQKLVYDPILSRNDVVISAETGSGKTLAYLLPVLNQYFSKKIERQETPGGYKYPSTVVIVPNKDLMAQAHTMCHEILTNAKQGTLEVTCGCMERVDELWPYKGRDYDTTTHCPDILFCTPAFLGAFIRGPHIREEKLFRSISCCIIDEADMIFEGSYKKDMDKVLDAFKVTRRRLLKENDMKPHERVVQFILAAATLSTHGKFSVDHIVHKRFPLAHRIATPSFHKLHPCIEQDFLHVDIVKKSNSNDSDLISGKTITKDSRVELLFRALVDDLPPRYDGDDEDDDEEVGDEDTEEEKYEPRKVGGDLLKRIPPTMVFVNTAGKARDLANALRSYGNGILANTIVEFHKLVPGMERRQSLDSFKRCFESGYKVLICTDAAARGFDLPHVEHVIQAELALNVVQYMHRNGRASRAGKNGRATIIFDDSSEELVQSILSDTEDRTIDSSFSRRRGFRRRMKRRLRRLEQGAKAQAKDEDSAEN